MPNELSMVAKVLMDISAMLRCLLRYLLSDNLEIRWRLVADGDTWGYRGHLLLRANDTPPSLLAGLPFLDTEL